MQIRDPSLHLSPRSTHIPHTAYLLPNCFIETSLEIQYTMIEETNTITMSSPRPKFYPHPQSVALLSFIPILKSHLPSSNALYVRLQTPHNSPDRHCQFAATFPPQSLEKPLEVPEVYTILFADRSRHDESHIWLFNPLTTSM